MNTNVSIPTVEYHIESYGPMLEHGSVATDKTRDVQFEPAMNQNSSTLQPDQLEHASARFEYQQLSKSAPMHLQVPKTASHYHTHIAGIPLHHRLLESVIQDDVSRSLPKLPMKRKPLLKPLCTRILTLWRLYDSKVSAAVLPASRTWHRFSTSVPSWISCVYKCAFMRSCQVCLQVCFHA